MTAAPHISVVMGVFNGAARLARTMDSLLSQEGVSFEVIAIDDGSTDETGAILDDYAAKDRRVIVLHVDRCGLTRALIAGCARARGEYIARQDCGDVSPPGRLARQAAFLRDNPTIAMVSVGTRFFTPCGAPLYEISQTTDELQAGLRGQTLQTIGGPSHHGATMFRKSAYDAVGGYRSPFRVAQDLDLWLRLAETASCAAIPELLYEASFESGAIGHLRREEQLQTARVILDCAARRGRGESDAPALEAWQKGVAHTTPQIAHPGKAHDARLHYFLAGLLRTRDPALARRYYRQSLRANFWQPRVWLRLIALGRAR